VDQDRSEGWHPPGWCTLLAWTCSIVCCHMIAMPIVGSDFFDGFRVRCKKVAPHTSRFVVSMMVSRVNIKSKRHHRVRVGNGVWEKAAQRTVGDVTANLISPHQYFGQLAHTTSTLLWRLQSTHKVRDVNINEPGMLHVAVRSNILMYMDQVSSGQSALHFTQFCHRLLSQHFVRSCSPSLVLPIKLLHRTYFTCLSMLIPMSVISP
jgi:hypothetical protein